MKKKISSIIMILAVMLISLPSVTLSAFKPATLFKGSDRIAVFAKADADRLFSEGYKLEQKLGFSPSTGYSQRLSQSITAIATTIYVTSVNDSDGIALPCSATNKCYFNLEPGTSKEERVVCTGVGATSFTGCTRGLVATGNSETGSSTLTKTHNAGSKIIMTNISQFYGNYVNLFDAQNVNGIKTFYSFPKYATSTDLPTQNGEFATKYYVDGVGAGGFTSVNASTTKGLSVYGTSPETVGVNASSTSGLSFNADGSLQITASTTGGIKADSNGIYVDKSMDYNWTGTTTFSGITIGSNVIYSATASTTITGGTLPQPVFIASSTESGTGKIKISDANNLLAIFFDGFAISSATDGNTVYIQKSGVVNGFTGLTAGMDYYVQDAIGTIGTSTGTYEIKVGKAISATQILIDTGDDEYVGVWNTTSASSSTTVPYYVKKVVIRATWTDSNDNTTAGDLTVYAKGKTVSYFYNVMDISVASRAYYITAELVGRVLTITHAATVGSVSSVNTYAYYYR